MSAVASLLAGTTMGAVASDSMNALPTTAAVPATGSSATPGARVTGNGQPISGPTSPRGHLTMSALMVLAAIGILLCGSRFLRDARIG